MDFSNNFVQQIDILHIQGRVLCYPKEAASSFGGTESGLRPCGRIALQI